MKESYFFAVEVDGIPVIDRKFKNFAEFYDFIESLDFSKFFSLDAVTYSVDLRPAYGRKDIYFETVTYNGFRDRWNCFERDSF